jgi:hypothetical protein
MRTTLDIEEDVLLAAKALARDRRTSVGKVMSDLARKGLTRRPVKFKTRNGFPLFPVQPGAGVVTLEIVNRLRDEEE